MQTALKEKLGPANVPKGLNERQRQRYLAIPPEMDYVYHESFTRPDIEEELYERHEEDLNIRRWHNFPQVPEDRLQATGPRKSPTKSQEQLLFLQYNYARWRLGRLIDRQQRRASKRRALEMIRWHRRVRSTRANLSAANMALVVAMAKRTRIPNVEFPELISEGNMALLRAIDKFDISRGYKFSTYACRAILKAFNRLAAVTARYVNRFGVEYDPDLERSDYDVYKHEMHKDLAVDGLREILDKNRARLTDVERTIVRERFALTPGGQKGTLAEVGEKVGLTSERVRQIQKIALAKIRKVLNEKYLVA